MVVSEPQMPASDSARETASAPPEARNVDAKAPRAPRSTATRGRLLAAGRELFCERGPHAVTSHAIAEKAGYASGTFYLHFKDKLSLFRELADEAALELERRLRSVAAEDSDPIAHVEAQAEALVRFAEEERDLLRIVFHPGSETGEIGAGILERLARGVSERRRVAVAGGRASDCFDSDVLAQAVVGMWAHVLAWWAEDPSRASRDAIVKTLTHFQLHGNRATEGAFCGNPVPNETPPQGDASR